MYLHFHEAHMFNVTSDAYVIVASSQPAAEGTGSLIALPKALGYSRRLEVVCCGHNTFRRVGSRQSAVGSLDEVAPTIFSP